MAETIFDKIISKEIPADILYEDELALAFKDINPQAPTHFLVIPKKQIATVNDIAEEDKELIGHMYWATKKIAADLDIAETTAIKNVLGNHAYNIPINSIKGATGNPLAAGGVLQAIASCISMSTGMIPPTTNYEIPDPDCDLDYTPQTPRCFEPSVALINSHGTGGVNSSLLLEKVKP